MILHNLLGRHRPDPSEQRWDNGLFVSACILCGRMMVKPASHEWQLAAELKRR